MNKELRQKLLEQLGLEKGEEVVDALIETYNNYELHEKPLVVIDYLVSTNVVNLSTLNRTVSLLLEATSNYLWVFGFKELYKVLAVSSFFYYLVKDNLTY